MKPHKLPIIGVGDHKLECPSPNRVDKKWHAAARLPFVLKFNIQPQRASLLFAILDPFEEILNKTSVPAVSLDAVGLVVLVNLKTISQRTALTGTASILDIFVLASGIHLQQDASDVSGGELPTTAAMTTGYVFRIENQAAVSYLQKIREPGSLVTVRVDQLARKRGFLSLKLFDGGFAPGILYLTAALLTPTAILFLSSIHDFWAIFALVMFMFARLINVMVIRRRTVLGWKGVKEPDSPVYMSLGLQTSPWTFLHCDGCPSIII